MPLKPNILMISMRYTSTCGKYLRGTSSYSIAWLFNTYIEFNTYLDLNYLTIDFMRFSITWAK